MTTSLIHAAAILLCCATIPAQAQRFASPHTRPFPDQATVPTLVVFVTVDQLLPEYFERYRTQLTGGLGQLANRGAMFTQGFQDHATTETAPGHASTMSGRFPRNTGIIRNSAGVQDPQAPLIGASGPGASPFRFRGGTLTDWLRFKDPRTRALSISTKDRGAILPVGRDPQHVYWYGWNGRFTTSTYYRDTLPSWVRAFNDRRAVASLAGRSWTLLLPDSAYAERDSAVYESGGQNFLFPHVLPADTTQAGVSVAEFPWMDELLLEFGLTGMRELGLGAGPQTDVLAISLSTTDFIGHRYGPDSREVHDQILRLDRALGAFFDTLFTLRDSANVVVALTADHGVAPYPEARQARGQSGQYVDLAALLKRHRDALVAKGIDSTAIAFEFGFVLANRALFTRARVNADSILRALANDIRRQSGVMRVDLAHPLAMRAPARDAIGRRWHHALPSDVPVELVVTLAPYNAWKLPVTYAQHGSPHDYDAHVPIFFLGRQFKPGRYTQFARVVDMAPTLAWLLATTPTDRVDGRILWEALK